VQLSSPALASRRASRAKCAQVRASTPRFRTSFRAGVTLTGGVPREGPNISALCVPIFPSTPRAEGRRVSPSMRRAPMPLFVSLAPAPSLLPRPIARDT
jgi:hypothetical protein